MSTWTRGISRRAHAELVDIMGVGGDRDARSTVLGQILFLDPEKDLNFSSHF